MDFIQTESHEFDKSSEVGVFSVSISAVIINEDKKVFLGKRASGRANEGDWEIVNGRVDQGESIMEALRREVREELSIEIDPLKIIGLKHYRRDKSGIEHQGLVFLCNTTMQGKIDVRETVEFGWFEFEDAISLCAEYEKPFLKLTRDLLADK